jgi:hypothetical protein
LDLMRGRGGAARGLPVIARAALIIACAALVVAWAAGCGAGDSPGLAGTAGGGRAAPAATVIAGPSPGSPGLLLEWRRQREPRERGSIGPDGLWIGPPEGPRAHYLFARRRYADDLDLFARTFAPFRLADAATGVEMTFQGHGAAAASAAEQRMMLAWSRRAAVEAAGDGGNSPVGLVLSWHRGAANGGICDDLAVYLSGEARAGSCGAGPEARGRLDAEQLARLYAWVDALQPFQSAEEGMLADALVEGVIFTGGGRRPPTQAEVAAIAAFAAALNHEVHAAAGSAAPQPDAAPTPPVAFPASPPAPPPLANANPDQSRDADNGLPSLPP